jgi:hypothetical protein
MGPERSSRARVAIVSALAVAGVLLGASTARAQPGDGGPDLQDQIVLTGRLLVPEGQTVGTAGILNGPATVAGTVRETLFVLNGDAEVSGTVGGDVVVVSGTLVVRSGAHIGGDVMTKSAPRIEAGARVDGQLRGIATRFDLQGFGFASRIIWWIGYSASTLVLGLLLLLMFPALDASAVRVWRERAGQAIGMGVAAFFVLPVAAVIFLVTIVGIPLGLFLLLALALLYTVGYVTGAMALGRLVVKPPASRFLSFLLGWVILRAVERVPFLGGLVWLVAAIAGLGTLFVAARRARPGAGQISTPPPPPPPPAQAAVTA